MSRVPLGQLEAFVWIVRTGSLVALTCRPALRARQLRVAYQTERPGAPIGAIELVVQVAHDGAGLESVAAADA